MSDYSTLLEDFRALDTYVATRLSPAVKDVPYLSGNASVGGILTVTNGNWWGAPTSYTYAFSGAGVADGANYTVDAADAGTSITCVVTATNVTGATAAPPSNAIAIAAATGMQQAMQANQPHQRATARNHQAEEKPEPRAHR